MTAGTVLRVLELVGLYTFATSGAVVVAATHESALPLPVVATCAAVLVFLFRIVAMLRHWTAPRAGVRTRPA